MNERTQTGRTGDGTVGKALATLELVAAQGGPVRFTELLADSVYPKATLYRLLQTLTHQGMLDYDRDAQTYAVGLRLVRLAHDAWRQSSLAPVARAEIDALAARVGETVHLAQMDRGQVLYVDKRNAADPVEMFSQAGKVGPAYCTGIGKAMLAFLGREEQEKAIRLQAFYRHTPNTITTQAALRAVLGRIRAAGVAFDREEHEPGIHCIAAPILSAKGRVLGAVSITTTTARSPSGTLDSHRTSLLGAAGRIADAAEKWRFPT